MYAETLYAFLVIVSLPFLNAQYLLRGQLPPLTTAPLFIREKSSACPPSQTSCVNDGSEGNGCCSIGVSCAFTKGTPICLEPCLSEFVTCTGGLNSLCCKPGYTCNYQSSLCISTGILSSSLPTTSKSLPPPLTSTFPKSTMTLPPQTSTGSKSPSQSMSSTTSAPSKSASKSSTSTTTSSEATSKSLAATTTSIATTVSTTVSTPTEISVVTASGQDKLRFGLKLLLGGCGLVCIFG